MYLLVVLSVLLFVQMDECVSNKETQVKENLKRLVLHNDEDMASEIFKLKQQMAEQSSLVQNITEEYRHTMQNLSSTVTKQKEDIEKLQNQMQEKDNKITQLEADMIAGSSYTRWGRTTCPGNGSTIVYSGYAAGTFFGTTRDHGDGAGGNYLCLASIPSWDYYNDDSDDAILLTGVEYSFDVQHKKGLLPQFLGSNVFGAQAPCAVCHVTRSTSVMISGRSDCYPGWTKEYSGYVVSGYAGYAHGTEYICLDRRPESVVNSGGFGGNNEIYFVEGHCQSGLECPPYVNGRELACVVCSF